MGRVNWILSPVASKAIRPRPVTWVCHWPRSRAGPGIDASPSRNAADGLGKAHAVGAEWDAATHGVGVAMAVAPSTAPRGTLPPRDPLPCFPAQPGCTVHRSLGNVATPQSEPLVPIALPVAPSTAPWGTLPPSAAHPRQQQHVDGPAARPHSSRPLRGHGNRHPLAVCYAAASFASSGSLGVSIFRTSGLPSGLFSALPWGLSLPFDLSSSFSRLAMSFTEAAAVTTLITASSIVAASSTFRTRTSRCLAFSTSNS